MATATLPKNGIPKQDSAKSATSNNVQPLVNAPGLRVEIPKEEEKKPEAVKVRTIQDELARIRQRYDLADKLEQLEATKARLEQFKLVSGGLRDKLLITDGSNEFTTSNTAVLEAVYECICNCVDDKVGALEKELLA